MTPNTLVAQLREKAAKTTRGPWHCGHYNPANVYDDLLGWIVAKAEHSSDDATYIATANPANLTIILDVVDEMRDALELAVLCSVHDSKECAHNNPAAAMAARKALARLDAEIGGERK